MTSAALSLPPFPEKRPVSRAAAVRIAVEQSLAARFPAALTPQLKPAPETIATGIAEVDALSGGIARGALTEICGAASSGRTTLLLSLIREVTRREEACALVDAGDRFDPASAVSAGADLRRLLWIRCARSKNARRSRSFTRMEPQVNDDLERVEQALKVTDLLLNSGGFSLVIADLGDIAAEAARRVPLASWFRFRRTVEGTATALVVVEAEPFAKTSATLALRMKHSAVSIQQSATAPTHASLLEGFAAEVEVVRGPVARKPVSTARFAAKAEWKRAG